MLRGVVLLTLVGLIGLGCSAGGGEACTSCHSELGAGGAAGNGSDVDAGPGTGGGAPAGVSGIAGNVGSTGDAGRGGTTGAAAVSGAAGAVGTGGGGGAGTTGSAGGTGSANTSGAAGTSGGAGATGSAGRGGTTGTAGTTGAAGMTTGSAGTTGAAGTTGGAGTTGAAGTTGGAGTTGTAGTTGAGGGGSSGATGGTGQVVMSIDFIGGRPPAGGTGGSTLVAAPAMAATEVAGVKPAARWNGAGNIMGTLANLVLADGTATTASVTWNSPSMGSNPGEWMVGFADMPGNTRMMNGYLDPLTASMPAVVTVSGLPASITGGGYDVYVYVTGELGTGTSTRIYNYAIGTTTFTVSQTGPTPTSFTAFTLAPAAGAGNYIVFRNLTAATFTLTATPGTGSATRAPVNGVQIVSPTGS